MVLAVATMWQTAAGADAKKTAAPAKPAAAPVVPERSIFVIPTNVKDGRDPFFPESTRAAQSTEAAPTETRTVEVSTLKVKGFYRDAKSALVIINNHTFAVGDEGDVITAGRRVHVRCLEIRPNLVVIEANGVKRELFIGGQ